MNRLAVVQCGGPTAVLNASLAGVLAEAGGNVLGVRGGPAGLAKSRLERIDPPADLDRLPGAYLGAGRFEWDEPALEAAARGLLHAGVRGLILIGGNGTMSLARRLAQIAPGLAVIGVPKTVDNDLCGIDHAPGYPSGAAFLRRVIPALAHDQLAMRSIEPVRIVETLGRDTGWLAAAAGTAAGPEAAPHLVFLPEHAASADSAVGLIDSVLSRRGWAFVVLAEGALEELSDGRFRRVEHGRPLFGGTARRLARLVTGKLGVAARGEVLGMAQRSAFALASDREDAVRYGRDAVRLLGVGARSVMAGDRGAIDLQQVAGRTRGVPPEWVGTPEAGSPEFAAWLSELTREG
ncbi:MAG TPA: 6-phosphofructokinase [Mycobacteriales bacterium]|nr:6-phosphofructokinase [Mycobacteriales bacterium]